MDQSLETVLMAGIFDNLESEIELKNINYLDEQSIRLYEFSDTHMISKDASMMAGIKYYIDYSVLTLYNFLVGPVSIILDHAFLISIAMITRLVHLIIDIGPFPKRILLKNITTCILGIYLVELYLRRVSTSSIETCRTLIFTSLLAFAFLVSYNQKNQNSKTPTLGKSLNSHRTSQKFSSGGISLLILAPIFANEYYIHIERKQQHNYLRGILMTLTMKAVSQIYTRKRSKSDGFISQLTYLLHPASCISGLWHAKLETPHEVFTVATEIWKFSHQIYRFMMTSIKTFFVLIISTNLSELVYLVDSASSSEKVKLISEVYLIAQEFRFSHYFSCLLFKSLFNIWEDPYIGDDKKLKPCDIVNVEWPRSLLQVVTSWNIPMHVWLKDYVFKPVREKTNTAAAILSTYLVSSLLHGFKFHIWVVLLTLGLLTWIEHHLRFKLATRYSACILAQKCRYTLDKKCARGHKYTVHNSSIVRLFNSSFTIMSMVHLAYLGYIFLGDTDAASYRDVIRLWSELSFFGHFIAAITYLISLVV